MKEQLKQSVVNGLFSGLIYIAISFIIGTADVFEWNWLARLIFVVLVFLIILDPSGKTPTNGTA